MDQFHPTACVPHHLSGYLTFGNLLAQSFLECAWVWQSRPLCGGGLPVFIDRQLHISDKINWTYTVSIISAQSLDSCIACTIQSKSTNEVYGSGLFWTDFTFPPRMHRPQQALQHVRATKFICISPHSCELTNCGAVHVLMHSPIINPTQNLCAQSVNWSTDSTSSL